MTCRIIPHDSRLTLRRAQCTLGNVTKAPQPIDPLLEVWGTAIRVLRRSVNTDGDPLADDEEPMTQEQLGAELDPPVRQSTVARWESGLREPRRRYRKQLADFFELPQDWMFPASIEQARIPTLPPKRRTRKAVA